MNPAPRPARFLVHVAVLSLFGLLPLAARELLGEPRDHAASWAVLEAEARGRAAAVDATIERWLPSVRERAQEIAAVLAQLPAGPFGKAAEATLLLHLERRLQADPEMDRYLVLAPDGKVVLAVGTQGPPTAEALPEVAQAAQRPSAALVRPRGSGRPALVVAAPFQRAGALGGLFVARVRAEVIARILPAVGELHANLIDAAGLSLLPAGESGGPPLSIGLESRAGRTTARPTGAPVAYVPLQGARAVLAITGGGSEGGGVPLWALAVAVLLGAVLAALLFTRSTVNSAG
jgi:hypothetical protein